MTEEPSTSSESELLSLELVTPLQEQKQHPLA